MYALGLEQAGHEVIGFCEQDIWAKKILKKHWPTKPISSSIQSLNRALTALLAAGRVRICQLPVPTRPQALKVNEADFGQPFLEPFAWYDQKGRCWRTWQSCLIEGMAKYSEPWPPSGMMHNGIAYRLKPLDCPINAKDFIQLPTLLASDYKGTSRKRYRGGEAYRGGRITEILRNCPSDPIYTHPSFAEAVMGLPKDFTLLETETLPKSSGNLQGEQ